MCQGAHGREGRIARKGRTLIPSSCSGHRRPTLTLRARAKPRVWVVRKILYNTSLFAATMALSFTAAPPAVDIHRTGTANTASIAITICTSTCGTSNIFTVCGHACELLLLPPPCSESDVDSGPHICPVVLLWAARPAQGLVGDRIHLRIRDLVLRIRVLRWLIRWNVPQQMLPSVSGEFQKASRVVFDRTVHCIGCRNLQLLPRPRPV